MPTDTDNPVSPESLKRRHEAQPPHLRNVVIILVSVVFMIVFCLTTVEILIRDFSKHRAMQSMLPYGIIAEPNLKPLDRFPKPNLQVDDDHAEMTALLAGQKEKLNSYGWIDRSNGIVHIPISRATDLILRKGLPTRTNEVSQTEVSPLQLIQERPEQR